MNIISKRKQEQDLKDLITDYRFFMVVTKKGTFEQSAGI